MKLYNVVKASAYIMTGAWSIYILTQSTDIMVNYITAGTMLFNLLINDLR